MEFASQYGGSAAPLVGDFGYALRRHERRWAGGHPCRPLSRPRGAPRLDYDRASGGIDRGLSSLRSGRQGGSGSEPSEESVEHQPRAMDASAHVLWRSLENSSHLVDGQLEQIGQDECRTDFIIHEFEPFAKHAVTPIRSGEPLPGTGERSMVGTREPFRSNLGRNDSSEHGGDRRCRSRCAKAALIAIRYSHVAKAAVPRHSRRSRYAERKVCRVTSATSPEDPIRRPSRTRGCLPDL